MNLKLSNVEELRAEHKAISGFWHPIDKRNARLRLERAEKEAAKAKEELGSFRFPVRE